MQEPGLLSVGLERRAAASRASWPCALGLALAALAGPSSPARAQSPTVPAVLFSQAPDHPGPFGAWASSTPLSAAFAQGFQTFDDFTLAQTSLISTVRWQGLYLDLVAPASNPVAANTALWGVAFASDAGGFPGLVTTQLFSPLAVTRSLAGQASFVGSTVNVYDFALALATPFVAQRGTRYWFSPVSVQPAGSDALWAWTTGAGGTFGTGVSRQYTLTAGGRTFGGTRGDMAFTLIGAAAPEPSPAGLLGLVGLIGLVGLAGRARQFRILTSRRA